MPAVRGSTARVLVAALGAFVAHQVAYAIVAASGAPDHGYLTVGSRLLVPLGLVAVVLLGIRLARARIPRPDLGDLLRIQLIIYLAQEVGERVVDGTDVGEFLYPALWLGLLLQPLAAYLVLRLVTASGNAVRRLEELHGSIFSVARPETLLEPDAARPARPAGDLPPVPSRGPPSVVGSR